MIDSWLVSSTVIISSSFQALTPLRRVAWHFTTCVSCTCRDRWRWLASTSWSCYGCLYIPIHTTELYTCHTVIYIVIHHNTICIVICIMPSCYVHHSLSDCQCNIRNTSTKHDQAPAAGGVSSTGRDLSCEGWPMVTLDPGMFAEPNASLETGSSGVAVASGCSSPATSERMILQISGGHTVQMEIYEQLWTYIKESPAPPWKLHCWRQVSTFAICQTVKAWTKIHLFLPYLPFSLVWGENKGVVFFFRGTGLQEQYLYMLYKVVAVLLNPWRGTHCKSVGKSNVSKLHKYIYIYILNW